MSSLISWLHRPGFLAEVWNWVTGCSKISSGCAYCYAERLALRYHWTDRPWTPANETFNIRIHDDRFNKPLGWRARRMIFVNSMADAFHSAVPLSAIREAFRVMRLCPQHIFIICTKRPDRDLGDLDSAPWPDNVWLGVTVENEQTISRLDEIQRHPASTYFLSCEPLLTALPDLRLRDRHIQWLIVGGESGPSARPMEMEWARALRDQCVASSAAYFFKQTGGVRAGLGEELIEADGSRWRWRQWPGELNPPLRADIPQPIPEPISREPEDEPEQLSLFDAPDDVGPVAEFRDYLSGF